MYLRYGWADYVQIRYVVGDGSTDWFPQVIRVPSHAAYVQWHSLFHCQQGVLLVVDIFIICTVFTNP